MKASIVCLILLLAAVVVSASDRTLILHLEGGIKLSRNPAIKPSVIQLEVTDSNSSAFVDLTPGEAKRLAKWLNEAASR